MFQYSVVGNRSVQEDNFTHCGLVMPYGNTNICQYLVEVTASSHYLSQCWLYISNHRAISQEMLKITLNWVWKILIQTTAYPRGHWVKHHENCAYHALSLCKYYTKSKISFKKKRPPRWRRQNWVQLTFPQRYLLILEFVSSNWYFDIFVLSIHWKMLTKYMLLQFDES